MSAEPRPHVNDWDDATPPEGGRSMRCQSHPLQSLPELDMPSGKFCWRAVRIIWAVPVKDHQALSQRDDQHIRVARHFQQACGSYRFC